MSWKKKVVKWVFVCFLCVIIGFLFAKFKTDMDYDSAQILKKEVASLSLVNRRLASEKELFALQKIQYKSQISSLLDENRKLNVKVNKQADKIYFYKRVISPEDLPKGIEVFSFSVVKSELKGERKVDAPIQWEYELVLMQAQKGRRFLSGKYDIVLSYFEGEDKTLKKISLEKLNKKLKKSFKFKYFQTIKGSIYIPANFTVDEVNITLKVPGNRWYRAQSVSQSYEWEMLVNLESGRVD